MEYSGVILISKWLVLTVNVQVTDQLASILDDNETVCLISNDHTIWSIDEVGGIVGWCPITNGTADVTRDTAVDWRWTGSCHSTHWYASGGRIGSHDNHLILITDVVIDGQVDDLWIEWELEIWGGYGGSSGNGDNSPDIICGLTDESVIADVDVLQNSCIVVELQANEREMIGENTGKSVVGDSQVLNARVKTDNTIHHAGVGINQIVGSYASIVVVSKGTAGESNIRTDGKSLSRSDVEIAVVEDNRSNNGSA